MKKKFFKAGQKCPDVRLPQAFHLLFRQVILGKERFETVPYGCTPQRLALLHRARVEFRIYRVPYYGALLSES